MFDKDSFMEQKFQVVLNKLSIVRSIRIGLNSVTEGFDKQIGLPESI